jgi:hypothetical protein
MIGREAAAFFCYGGDVERTDARIVLERLAGGYDDLKVKGKKTPYLAMNGNMFAFVDDTGGICLRFDEPTRVQLADAFGTGEVVQYGAVMRGYVAIPDELAGEGTRLSELFSQSVTHARTLKPKPTKRT